MKKRQKATAGQAWREVRTMRPTREFRDAYAERRLELEAAALLAELRRQRGLSQQQLAEMIGTRQPAIARMEGGENITLARLQKIASLLGARIKLELELDPQWD
jgi:ribosome-binding protein aMBF1 (putative translation factor)